MKAIPLLAAALALAVATPASAQSRSHAHQAGHSHHGGARSQGAKPKAMKTKGGHLSHARPHAAASVETASTREFREAHVRMMAGMDQPFTGDADIDFRVHMIPHHQGAIDMARVAMRHAKDPWTRQLAEAVIVEQQREIAEMQAWLAKRGVAAPAGGQPRHTIGSGSYRTLHEEAGTRGEARGQSWAPGSGIR